MAPARVGDPAAIDPIAAALPGVRSVEPSPDNDRYRVVTSIDDVAGPLATALAAAGLALRGRRNWARLFFPTRGALVR